MESIVHSLISQQLEETVSIIKAMSEDSGLINAIEMVADKCRISIQEGNKLLFIGNGGSAADCQHLAGELVSRFAFDRPGLPAFALTTDTSVLTAIGNDYGYEQSFSRQVEAVGKPGDVLFGISTSGRSSNVISAMKLARSKDLVTVAMTGNRKSELIDLTDFCIEIPSSSTPKIQEGHIIVGHIICMLIERQIFLTTKI